MCATQMNTSDNPELWDITVKFLALLWVNATVMSLLKMASSCYFFGFTFDVPVCTHGAFSLAYNVLADFLQAWQEDFRSPNHSLVTNDSAGFLCNRHHTCVHHTARTIALASDYSVTDRQRFTITTFCKPLGLLFPTWGNMGLDTTQRDHHIWFQHRPCHFSALRYLLRLLSFLLLLN